MRLFVTVRTRYDFDMYIDMNYYSNVWDFFFLYIYYICRAKKRSTRASAFLFT